jgi:hypothetical protein
MGDAELFRAAHHLRRPFRVKAFQRTDRRSRGRRAPAPQLSFAPEHVPEHLQDDWYDQHFRHIGGNTRLLRRAAEHLVQDVGEAAIVAACGAPSATPRHLEAEVEGLARLAAAAEREALAAVRPALVLAGLAVVLCGRVPTCWSWPLPASVAPADVPDRRSRAGPRPVGHHCRRVKRRPRAASASDPVMVRMRACTS